jgi:eight-cysteine-cluster-containing protein
MKLYLVVLFLPVCYATLNAENNKNTSCNNDNSTVCEVVRDKNIERKSNKSTNNCVISGCSGEICGEEKIISTCLFLPHYKCYKFAKCIKVDSVCKWYDNSGKLAKCLKDNS